MRIAIVGTGISGVTLALRLQQLGVDSTLFSDRTGAEIRDGQLLNTVARFRHTLDREASLGVDHWAGAGHAFHSCHLSVGAPLDVAFVGRAADRVEAVDFRLLLPRWMEDYAARGGRVVHGMPSLDRAVDGHDLVVVAVGRSSRSTLFPVDPVRSPHTEPRRLLLAALVDGLSLPEPLGLSFNVVPGVGELFQMPILTAAGLGTNILIEAVPDGPLAEVVTRSVDDPRFVSRVRDALETFAPAIAARVDGARFRLRSPRDVLQGAVTPAVRHAFARLPGDGSPALAVGDAWVTNDPVTGQGANVGSHCAFVAADAIAAGGPFDGEWGAAVEAAMWEFAGPVTSWTNAFLGPPSPHVVQLLLAASEQQAVADALISGFGTPVALAAALGSPDATQSFIESASGRLAPVA